MSRAGENRRTKQSLFLFAISLCVLLTSCFCPQHYAPTEKPPPLPNCPVIKKPIRLALVLGGGGARGIAHVGVLEELEEAGIPLDVIIGCSAGSIVGALYADCLSTKHLKEVFLTLQTNYLMDFNLWTARYGLCQGKTLRKFLDCNLDADNFEDLKMPFFAVATDLYSAELIPIGGGPLAPAIEASASIPFIFVPVSLHGRVLVDGGVTDPVPVKVAHHLGAEIIVAVDLRGLLAPRFPTNLFGVAERSAEIALLWQSEECVRNADVIIRPELGDTGCFDNLHHEVIFQAGKDAAKNAIPQIRALLERYNQQPNPSYFSETAPKPIPAPLEG